MHRSYVNEDITVFWDSDKCFHAKRCVTGCPEAFDITKKPWINIDNAPTSKVWQAVSACPSGALTVVYNHGVIVRSEGDEYRSVAFDGDRLIGECCYSVEGNVWNIYHTQTDPGYTGRGIAKRLVYSVLQEAERSGNKVTATCSYARHILG